VGDIGRVGDGRISFRLVRIDSSIDRNRFLTIPASILIDTAYLESLPSLITRCDSAPISLLYPTYLPQRLPRLRPF